MQTLTPGEVSKLLDIPGSTLRRYVANFGDYLSPEAQRRRSRHFTESDIQVIARIRDLTGQGIRLDDISQHLDQTYDAQQPAEEDITALALPGLVKQLDGIADLFQQQQREINDLRREIEDLKKPWYKRLFGD